MDENKAKKREIYDRFEKLLNMKGVTAYKVSQATGISTATLTNWKNLKYTPKSAKLKLIAEFFNVPESYFYTGEMEIISDVPTFDDVHLELIYLYDKLNKEQQTAFLNMLRSATPKK